MADTPEEIETEEREAARIRQWIVEKSESTDPADLELRYVARLLDKRFRVSKESYLFGQGKVIVGVCTVSRRNDEGNYVTTDEVGVTLTHADRPHEKGEVPEKGAYRNYPYTMLVFPTIEQALAVATAITSDTSGHWSVDRFREEIEDEKNED